MKSYTVMIPALLQADICTWASAPASRLLPQYVEASKAPGSRLEVPTVDLANPDEDELVRQLRSACTDVGFFHLSGHKVDPGLIARQFERAAEFFALPLAQKLEAEVEGSSNRGYFKPGRGSAKNAQAEPDRKEAFNMYCFETDATELPFHGRNRWPAALPGFRKSTEEYYAAMHGIGLGLLRLIALALDLPADFFDDKFDRPVANIRAVHYFEQEGDAQSRIKAGVFGVGAHTDWGMLTVLSTDGQPGLQILDGGRWVDVVPQPHGLVVNLGDLLHRWTAGRFRSTLHRVVTRTPRERFSMPYFLAPNWDAQIKVLDGCMRPGEEPPPAVTCGQWLTLRREAEYGQQSARLKAA